MTKIKQSKLKNLVTSLLLVFSVVAAPFASVQTASAAGGTATWTGEGANNNFSNADNWEEEAIPEAGDLLIFSSNPELEGEDFYQDLYNDVDVAFSGITVNYSGSGAYRLLNDLDLQDGAEFQLLDGILSIVNDKKIIVAGDIDISSPPGQILPITSMEITGTITIKSPAGSERLEINGLPLSYDGLVVEKGVAICIATVDTTITADVTLGGGSSSIAPAIDFYSCGFGGGSDGSKKLTINNLTLLADSKIGVTAPNTVEIENITKNGFSISRHDYSDGTLILPGGQVIQNEAKTTNLDGEQPDTSVTVADKETAILNGSRDYINVGFGGILKGNGTAASVNVFGTIAPGLSPGKITILNSFILSAGGTYQAEILNKDSYDQVVFNGEQHYSVQLDGTLDLILYEGWSINEGDQFMIIENKSEFPVSGIFEGLDEAAQLEVEGITFSITYTGGDGNDVVLTALNTGSDPDAPDTGVKRLKTASPLVLVVLTVLTVGVATVVRRQTSKR